MQLTKQCVSLFIATMSVTCALAQDASMKKISLEDLSAFKSQAGNWRIVGDVKMNPGIDVSHHAEAPAQANSKKNKKSKAEPATSPQAVTFTEGKGILLNLNDDTKKDALITTWEHGDIELEMEVMLPKGSNSGVYLQGRYEVQLYDSWGVKNPSYTDIGGIYRNWESEAGKIYMGKAPLTNAAKAPGLWQTLKISFRAPKFDSNGKKIANAQFTSVELNGVKIHDHVEVPLPTGGPIENNEKAMGPLTIQGDHGPVAFRNIKYQLMKEADFSLSDISYKIYHGNFISLSGFTSQKESSSGTSEELSAEVLDVDNEYGIIYSGNITVSEDANYEFTALFTGIGKLVINKQENEQSWGQSTVKIALKPGSYPFEIYNAKKDSWMPPRLALFAKADDIYPKALHAFNSFPPDDDPAPTIFIQPGGEPKLLRAFLDFKGDRAERLTHTIGVGDPSGTHYIYDLKAGNLVCVWKGNFVDATPMWHDRGDGSFRPRGATQYFFTGLPLAYLANANDPFTKQPSESDFRTKGYEIEAETSRPIFKYLYQGLEVEDKIYPDDNNKIITREIQIKNRGSKQGLYFKLAEGSTIIEMADGSYAIDDKKYYIKSGNTKPVIRDNKGMKELVLTVDGSNLKYSIIW